jgi:hypothetical protein
LVTFTEHDTKETLTVEQLELMAQSDDEFLTDYLAERTIFDAHRIRLLLELGSDKAKEMRQAL